MSLTSDELLFAAGGDVWEKYGTFVKRTLPEEERGTFSRSSDATYTDRSGSLRTAESGILRPHYVSSESSYSARLEAARTNELHNSDSPATQTRNLTAGTYTLWMEGSGSVDASGATDGSYGTATEGQSNDLTFTVSAQQDVTFTVNNTVTRFQCEEGSFRSSFITTAGSAVSRAADDLTFPISWGPQEMTVYLKFIERGSRFFTFPRLWEIGNNDARFLIYNSDSTGEYKAYFENEDNNIAIAVLPDHGSFGQVVEYSARLYSDGSVDVQSALGGGSVSTSSQSAAPTGGLGSSWGVDEIEVMGGASGASGDDGYGDVISGPIIAPGVRTLAEMRSVEV